MGVVPLLVGPERIQQANALLSFSRSTVTVIGPAAAGALVVGAGPGWALLVDALLFLVAIPMLMRVGLPGRVRDGASPASSMVADLREGWGVRPRTWVWVIVGAFGMLNAIHIGAVFVLGPVIATSTSVGEQGWGLALSAEAAGTVLVTVLLLRKELTRPLLVGMMAVTTLALPIAVLGLAPRTDLLVLAFFVAGAGVETFGVGWSTSLHQHIPEAVLSRVSSHDALGSFVAMPVGRWSTGGWPPSSTTAPCCSPVRCCMSPSASPPARRGRCAIYGRSALRTSPIRRPTRAPSVGRRASRALARRRVA